MTAAIKRRLRRDETITQYYDDKMKDLRHAQLPERQMVDVFTEGLSEAYCPYFYGRRFQTPSQWLGMALDIENDLGNTKFKPQNPNNQAVTVRRTFATVMELIFLDLKSMGVTTYSNLPKFRYYLHYVLNYTKLTLVMTKSSYINDLIGFKLSLRPKKFCYHMTPQRVACRYRVRLTM